MPTKPVSLNGKSVIITGGASGIGLAVVDRLAPTGAYITIIDKDIATQSNASRWTAPGQHVQFIKCDITDWQSQCGAFKEAARFSPTNKVDTVILVAGITDGVKGRLVESALNSEADPMSELAILPPTTSAIDVNLIGTYYSAWLACRYFRVNDHDVPPSPFEKSLVFIGSTSAYAGLENSCTSYWASKWGTRGIFQSIKDDTKRVGARCNLVAPHFVKTKMIDYFEDAPSALAEMEDVIDIIQTCVIDTTIHGLEYRILTYDGILTWNLAGRSFAVFPRPLKCVDMKDDIEGSYAGPEVSRIFRLLSQANATQGSVVNS